MKNKTIKDLFYKIFHRAENKNFRQFKTKISFRVFVMLILAGGSIYLMDHFFLRGHFANWAVALNQKFFGLDYQAARTLYQWTFRNHIDLVVVVASAIVFFVIFRIYLNRFILYFTQINQGIDDLASENRGEVSLPPELADTEKKINAIKHTLEKQRLDAELAQQQKNDLIMYLAHDLKTPLASVIGYLNLLRDEKEISEELREKYLSVALNKAESLEDLIQEFFEIAKYNLSNITLQYHVIHLTRLLEMLLYEFQPLLREKNLRCHLHAAEDIMLNCDADKMQRVFDNLLKNAAAYSYQNTDIDITVAKQEDKITVCFKNHGAAIPEEKLERVFEQFYRLDASRGTKEGGAGLGLAIARQIVELHKGTITVKCENEIIEFEVTLPAS